MGEQDALPSTQDAMPTDEPRIIITPQVTSGQVVDALMKWLPRDVMVEVVEVIERVDVVEAREAGGMREAVEPVDRLEAPPSIPQDIRGKTTEFAERRERMFESAPSPAEPAANDIAAPSSAFMPAALEEVRFDSRVEPPVSDVPGSESPRIDVTVGSPDVGGLSAERAVSAPIAAPMTAPIAAPIPEPPPRAGRRRRDRVPAQAAPNSPGNLVAPAAPVAPVIACESSVRDFPLATIVPPRFPRRWWHRFGKAARSVAAEPVAAIAVKRARIDDQSLEAYSDDPPRVREQSSSVLEFAGPRWLRPVLRFVCPDPLGRLIQHPVLQILAGIGLALIVLWWILGG